MDIGTRIRLVRHLDVVEEEWVSRRGLGENTRPGQILGPIEEFISTTPICEEVNVTNQLNLDALIFQSAATFQGDGDFARDAIAVIKDRQEA